MTKPTTVHSRRTILRMGLTIPPLLLAGCVAPVISGQTPAPPAVALPTVTPSEVSDTADVEAAKVTELLPPTPACDDDDEPTLAQTEGPFYTPNSPERSSFLEPGITGTRMIVTGYVLSTACQPIGGALLDFWHCDDAGVYDNTGYRLRGHFYADDEGRYLLETIMPAVYTGRTRHFHVKVQAPNQPVLTTQLYFPGEPANERDRIFRPELLMAMQESGDSKVGIFNFVLQVA
jgi:protocatechuate 3,4-dioxygenase beta subunit